MKLAEFSKVAKILAKEHHITIEEGESWAANLKKREIYYKKEDIFNLSEDHVLGLLLHEIAHIHYTGDVNMPKKNPELTHSTLNMLEDIAIEHIIGDDYPNAGEILESTRMECLDVLVKMLPKLNHVVTHEKALLYAATRFNGRGYMFQTEDYEKLGDEISILMKTHENDILNRKHTKDLLRLAEQIVEILIKKAGELTENEKKEIEINANMQGAAGKDSEQRGTPQEALIKELKKGGNGWQEGTKLHERIGFINEIIDQAPIIGRQLRSVLKRNNAMEYGGRYRTGKLRAKRFVRIKVMKDRRPFARRIVKSNQSYAFAVASDVSGSMFSNFKKDPASYALSSMMMVGEALRLAGIPRAMITFGGKAFLATPMSKKQIRWDEIASENGLKKSHQGNTCIDLAINACRTELGKIRAERKIMIILTDGSSNLWEMREAHKKATQEGIECLGISIGEDDRDSYMDKTFTREKNTKIKDINNTNLIGEAFIKILKTSIAASP